MMTPETGSVVTDPERAIDVLWHALSELSRTLGAEREALTDLRADIDAVGARKRQAVLAVEAAEQVRRAGAPHCRGERWDAVLVLAERCRHQNLTNGALLALRKRHTDRLLASLRGQTEPGLYGASGYVATPSATGRSHVSA